MAIRKPRKSKVVKINHHSMLNIGTFMFGILFVYMIICLIMYLTSPHVTAYEVTAGPLSGNYKYTALALKSEKVVYSTGSGAIQYYARENSKVGVGNAIYSLGALSASQSELGTQSVDASAADTDTQESTGQTVAGQGTAQDNTDFSSFRNIASSFSTNYSSMDYQTVYNFKADAQTAIFETYTQNQTSSSYTGQNLITTDTDGIVVYSIDGMEDKTADDVRLSDFNKTNYKRTNLRMKDSVSANDPVYKLITSEEWSLIIPLDIKTATELADSTTVRFTFLEDKSTFNADFSILQNEDGFFGKLDISNSVIRFAGDRFIDIELQINKASGLKIPNTAIAEKTFYRIPKEYVSVNEDNEDEISLIKETYDTDGSAITKYITATVYDKTDTDYYVDTGLFEEGDYVLMKDSSKRYQISDTKSLIGVYNINKGYAVFREITIIDENEEYCIVESNSSYGLAQYDHIALDASTVKEDAIVV